VDVDEDVDAFAAFAAPDPFASCHRTINDAAAAPDEIHRNGLQMCERNSFKNNTPQMGFHSNRLLLNGVNRQQNNFLVVPKK